MLQASKKWNRVRFNTKEMELGDWNDTARKHTKISLNTLLTNSCRLNPTLWKLEKEERLLSMSITRMRNLKASNKRTSKQRYQYLEQQLILYRAPTRRKSRMFHNPQVAATSITILTLIQTSSILTIEIRRAKTIKIHLKFHKVQQTTFNMLSLQTLVNPKLQSQKK